MYVRIRIIENLRENNVLFLHVDIIQTSKNSDIHGVQKSSNYFFNYIFYSTNIMILR